MIIGQGENLEAVTASNVPVSGNLDCIRAHVPSYCTVRYANCANIFGRIFWTHRRNRHVCFIEHERMNE